jgi:predicted RNA-binding Zn ribbon-like protein
MTVAWTAHRFSGGVLALDVANTVVMRGDIERGFDRFDDPAELPRFAEAATLHRADELKGVRLACAEPQRAAGPLVELREAADALFREASRGDGLPAALLAAFAAACGRALSTATSAFGRPQAPFGLAGSSVPLEAATAWSALSLLAGNELRRLRICGNCGWLFVDRSRNGSRLWCDMAVCGNRQMAKRHYHRRKQAREEAHG